MLSLGLAIMLVIGAGIGASAMFAAYESGAFASTDAFRKRERAKRARLRERAATARTARVVARARG